MSKQFPWYKSYPEFVPQTVDENKYKSLAQVFEDVVEKYGDKVAFQNMDVTLTYNQLKAEVDAFAYFLQNKTNLEVGDRVAIQMPNLLQFPVAMFAIIKCGFVAVNTNPLYTPDEMRHQYKDSGAKALVILENFASNYQSIQNDTDIETVIVTRIGDMLGGLKGTIVNTVVKHVKKMVPAYDLPNAISFKSVLKDNSGKSPNEVNITHKEMAFLQYTGGTTGVSKGAILTHGNICSQLSQVDGWLTGLFKDGEAVVITALPLYHIFALTANCLAFFNYGSRNVLITNPRDMKAFLKDLKKNPFSLITGVNTLFNGLLNQPTFKDIDFSNLKISLGGGMAVQDAVAIKWQEVTGSPLLEAYGLSETSPAATINPTDGSHRMGSIGLPIPNTEIRIFDEDKKEVASGERGEIGIKGPQVMAGYWNRPDATKEVMHGDYFLTGDIGIMDEDGFFKIVDRKKEMVCVSGFNVYPSEVEAVISSHPKVLEVGVRSEPHPKTTECVMAFIVKKDDSLTEDEIKDFCKDKLTNYKHPKIIVFRDELPKSNVGKILRRKLI
ncbi:AMP-binding protein [Bacteroidia bacterium]|jgi:long-chain acyl-CoA synthetase|nr:AMP-binding protein [Bacteroidia bacterium]MDC0561612.1 AMP-binding protein [Bacteroidia bacterium]MDC3406570.1 AMP-binding protein [Bacteroidia bacterium]